MWTTKFAQACCLCITWRGKGGLQSTYIPRAGHGLWTTLVSTLLLTSLFPYLTTRPLDDDYAAYKLAVAFEKPANVTDFLLERGLRAPFTLFNDETGFKEARNADGSWTGEDNGWTEGSYPF